MKHLTVLILLSFAALTQVSGVSASEQQQPAQPRSAEASGASASAAAAASQPTTEHPALKAAAEVQGGPNQCWSAKKCEGKLRGNFDAHNCKVRHDGKSWRANATATCVAL